MDEITVYIEELLAMCSSKENIYIYGAGRYADRVYHFLERRGITVTGFVVSDMEGNPERLFDREVFPVDRLGRGMEYLILVPMFNAGESYREIFDHLTDNHIFNAWFFPADLLCFVREESLRECAKGIFRASGYYIAENAPVEAKHFVFAMQCKEGGEYHWRIRETMIDETTACGSSGFFPNRSALEEFEEQYGKYHIFHTRKAAKTGGDETYAVYMSRSHVDKAALTGALPSWITPIQVGAALTDHDICEVKDNTGDNISEKNRIYSECTALYWMWRNAPRTDYIGLCHYRRHFDIGEDEIKMLAASGTDVLVTAPTFVKNTVAEFFLTLIPKSDMSVMLEAIKKVQPAYAPSAEKFLASRFYPPCNLFIMRYDLFQEYGAYAFSVTFEIERFYDSMGFFRRDRYMGYIMECLLGIFLMHHKETLEIAYADMRFYS